MPHPSYTNNAPLPYPDPLPESSPEPRLVGSALRVFKGGAQFASLKSAGAVGSELVGQQEMAMVFLKAGPPARLWGGRDARPAVRKPLSDELFRDLFALVQGCLDRLGEHCATERLKPLSFAPKAYGALYLWPLGR